MNNKNQVVENNNFYIKVAKKTFSSILLFCSISLLLILVSFHPEDSGWGVVSENIPKNFYGEIGSLISGLVIREFGILTGLLFSSILFAWSLKLFNETQITLFKTKIFTIFVMIFFSSLGGTYVETKLIQGLNLNLPVINQNGLSEWLLIYFSHKTSHLISLNFVLVINLPL